jgi:uncharacterized protein YkwD
MLAAVAACALAAPANAASPCAGQDLRPATSNLDTIRSATLCLLNQQRASFGLIPLTENVRLTEASNAYSQEMIARGFFGHVDPDGTTLAQRLYDYGYLVDTVPDWLAGENIAWAEGSLSTPFNVVDAWMHSPDHRANILEPRFREIGLGVALGSPTGDAPDQAATYTTDFGELDDGAGAPTANGEVENAPAAGVATTSKRHSSSSARRRARAAAARRAARKICARARTASTRSARRKASKRCAAARARAHKLAHR